jgi:hypothetical protein
MDNSVECAERQEDKSGLKAFLLAIGHVVNINSSLILSHYNLQINFSSLQTCPSLNKSIRFINDRFT